MVNINRSFLLGRVHKAIVTQLHEASGSVTVEWFEDDETKGKEVILILAFAVQTNRSAVPFNSPSDEV